MKWILISLAAIAIVVFFKYLRNKQNEIEENFQRRFAAKQIRFMDKNALYIAQHSDGLSHFRGMGYLVLTDEELYFERQLKKKIVSIPIHAISQVGETLRLGGQSPGKPMLKVDFKSEEGKADAIAWRVKELSRWQHEISALLKK